MLASASGQWASGVLYSSEQFGYGGQAFGRAYDASEITGDRGVAGGLELRYDGLRDLQSVTPQPYVFYDVGSVWNKGAGQPILQSGASAGLGLRFTTAWQQSGNIGMAWPLTRPVSVPIYGSTPYGPRLSVQFTQVF
jgi:hemolysin activation/secretion protein